MKDAIDCINMTEIRTAIDIIDNQIVESNVALAHPTAAELRGIIMNIKNRQAVRSLP